MLRSFTSLIIFKSKVKYPLKNILYFKFNYSIYNKNKKNKIMVFVILFFLKQCFYYIYYYSLEMDFKKVLDILYYMSIFLHYYINKHFIKTFDIKINKQKFLILLNDKNDIITNLYIYFSQLRKYYSTPQHYNQLYNIKHLNYMCINIFYFLYKYDLINVIDDTWLKWIGIGAWTFITSLFIRKKYKEYKDTFFYNYSNKYKYKSNLYNKFSTFWKVYYKYRGNYQQYLYLKNFFLLNKALKKKTLLVYDFKVNKFIVKLNNYYNLLLNELKTDPSFRMVEKDHVYSLFNVFLKKKLETPFLDTNISFTYFYFKKNINKKELEKLSYLVSYDYLYKKIKKSTISDLTENELFLNYKNFYQQTMSDNFEINLTDMYGVEGNDPLSTPARSYKKFQKWIDFEQLFTDIDKFQIEDLYDYIIKAFEYIKKTDIMLSINIDEIQNNDNIKDFDELDNAFTNNEMNFFDYQIIKNDLNLTVRLNTAALNDPSFINFLNELKYLTENATINVLNIDLFETKYLKDVDMLTLFLKERFFYLDYFTLAINSQKYTLCYLLFVFKVLKNKKNYELYYNQYCDKKINKYNKVIYDYHKHVSTKLQYLTNSFNGFIKYKTNNILININNFDNLNFIKKLKLKNFNKIYRPSYQNNIKINYKKDYKEFLNYFDSYKTIKNFEKKEINFQNVMTFDEYLYHDITLVDLYYSIELKKKVVEDWLKYYIYENNELLNFLDLGFYLYDIKGFENYQKDVFLFFEFKENQHLNFRDNNIIIDKKIEFQHNYSILYFHYLINLFKNLKHYIFNIVIENIAFDDAFVYLNFDNTMHQKRIDFMYHVECFMKTLKTIIAAKHSYIINFVNYLIFHYAKFVEYNKEFNYNLLYDSLILEKCNKEILYNLESNLDDIMQIWKHILDKIEDSRNFYIESIKMLKLENLIEFFDFPMFNKVKGFLLLKEAYFICLEELIIEERALDHAFNISMCLFRVFDRHNTFFKYDILYKNGIMTRLCFLSVEDWDYVLKLEQINPLILIELYNSKQSVTRSEYWNNTVSFMDIVYAISNISEKENAYNTLDEEWTLFFNKIATRDLIIYDLTEKDVSNLHELFIAYNDNWFNQLNIEDELLIFFENNNLKYDIISQTFKKIQNKELNSNINVINETNKINFEVLNYKKKKKSIDNSITNVNNVNLYLKDKLIYLNNEQDNIITFNNIMDKVHDIVGVNSDFLSFLVIKIKNFKDSNFKNFLLQFFNSLEVQYDDYTYLNNYTEFEVSLNLLFYLVKFYDNITALNEFDFSSIFLINNKIINNEFNYLDKNNNFMDLDYTKFIFKSINNIELENNWSSSLAKVFNNRFLFIYYNAQQYLLNIYKVLDKTEIYKKIDLEYNVNYLPNLNIYINKSNYNNNIIYNIYDSNFINTFNALFNALNVHILKVNYMLNQFNIFREIIFNIYLNYYELNKPNLTIIKDLFFFVYNNIKGNNFKHLALMNLLLYVKDPIYLYNILLYDLKIYVQNVITILDVINKPELHIQTYNTFLQFLMYKHKNLMDDWTKPLAYKGLTFSLYNTNRPIIKQKNLDKINVNHFFSYSTIIILNNAISNLDQYCGYFNLDNFVVTDIEQNTLNFDKELNLFDMFNVNKLLYNFDYLFTINNIKGLNFYTLKEFIVYNESNNFESLNLCFNCNMLLTHMLKQDYIYKTYLSNDSNFKKAENKQDKNLVVKEYEDVFELYKKKVKKAKRKSAPFILKKKKRKTKIIKILVKTELQPEDFKDYGVDNSEEDEEYQNDEYGTDVHYKYANLEVTDSEDSVSEDNVSDSVSENIAVNKKENKNIVEIKNEVVSNVHKNFRQWASDLEFRKAYFNCKSVFNEVLFDFSHPIWDEHKAYFSNSQKIFLNYVKNLTEQDKISIFNIFWDWTIKEVLNNRELERNKKVESYWSSMVYHASQQTDHSEHIRSNELLDIFCTNLKENERWKKRWHHDMYFLDMHRGLPGRESNWRAIEYWKESHYREPDLLERQRGTYERNSFKKKENQFELWDKTNWWKKW